MKEETILAAFVRAEVDKRVAVAMERAVDGAFDRVIRTNPKLRGEAALDILTALVNSEGGDAQLLELLEIIREQVFKRLDAIEAQLTEVATR